MPPKVSLSDAKKVISHYEMKNIDPKYIKYALDTEMEHTDITDGDLAKTAMIVMAHLREHPLYYAEIKKMERRLKKIPRPEIFH
jgi:hypothetical protein